MDFLFIFCLLGYCLILSRFLRMPIETTPFITVSVFILILYFAAYFGFLKLTALLLLWFGFASLLGMGTYLVIYSRADITKYLTPGIMVFIFLWLILSFFSIYVHLGGNDELAHWALFAKIVFQHNGLPVGGDQIGHKDYPPGAALFYYLFSLLNGRLSDWSLYVGQQTLILAPLVTFFQNVPWRQIFRIFLLFCFILFVLAVFFQLKIGLFGNLQMEQVVGVFFGMSIVFYLNSKKHYLIY